MHNHNLTVRLFKFWLSFLDKNRVVQMCRFQRRCEQRRFRQSFLELRQYAERKINYRKGMKRLLKLRAVNIMRVAFAGGLKPFWRQAVIDRDLHRVARMLDRARLQKRSLKSL